MPGLATSIGAGGNPAPPSRCMIAPLTMTPIQDISHSLRQLYLEDERPWLVGFSGGKGLS